MAWVRVSALAGLLKGQRGDRWSGFSVSTIDVSAVAGLLGEETLYLGLECLP